ncbi:MAG: hypothetical protein LBE89_06035 [Helicobacteraceae bacterium]|nr:hypothetical protein [Helicobacteraceae bacterium]
MWVRESSVRTKTDRKSIWALWSDVESWKSWDDSVEYSAINGAFRDGTKGTIKAKNAPESPFILIDCAMLESFTAKASLPLGKINFIHTMAEDNGEVVLTHRVEIDGLLTFLFSKIIGKDMERAIPAALNKLVKLAGQTN